MKKILVYDDSLEGRELLRLCAKLAVTGCRVDYWGSLEGALTR